MLAKFTNVFTHETFSFDTKTLTFEQFLAFFDYEVIGTEDEEHHKELYEALVTHDHEAIDDLLPGVDLRLEWLIATL